jgi:molecular chaperone Hsp33
MNLQDSIQRFVFENQSIRGEIVHLTESYQLILAQHLYPEAIRKLLGETLLAAVLLTAIIKFKGTLTIQFHGSGSGAVKMLVAKCDNEFNMRGLAEFDEAADQQQFEECFAAGKLVITIASESSSKPYQSIVPIAGLSISQCLENYFEQSEQLLTKIYLTADAKHATGIMLQLLPALLPEEREQFHASATRLTTEGLVHDLNAISNEDFLRKVYPHDDIRMFDADAVRFKCTCNIDKMRDAVKMLGQKEAETILLTAQNIEVCCEYCNGKYAFEKAEVLDIFQD